MTTHPDRTRRPFAMDEAVAILSRKPASPFDIVGHLIHGERTDWLPRANLRIISGTQG